MMKKRTIEFEKAVKLLSFWKVDKRKGDYDLPAGKLSYYLVELVMKLILEFGFFIDSDLEICDGYFDSNRDELVSLGLEDERIDRKRLLFENF